MRTLSPILMLRRLEKHSVRRAPTLDPFEAACGLVQDKVVEADDLARARVGWSDVVDIWKPLWMRVPSLSGELLVERLNRHYRIFEGGATAEILGIYNKMKGRPGWPLVR